MTINTQLITCILTTGIGQSRFIYFFTNPFYVDNQITQRQKNYVYVTK